MGDGWGIGELCADFGSLVDEYQGFGVAGAFVSAAFALGACGTELVALDWGQNPS